MMLILHPHERNNWGRVVELIQIVSVIPTIKKEKPIMKHGPMMLWVIMIVVVMMERQCGGTGISVDSLCPIVSMLTREQ